MFGEDSDAYRYFFEDVECVRTRTTTERKLSDVEVNISFRTLLYALFITLP